MMKYFLSFLIISVMASTFLGCSARQIQSAPISQGAMNTSPSPEVPVIAERSVQSAGATVSTKELKALNTKAKQPTFGIIKGFYQLPETFPGGAISMKSMHSFGFDMQQISMSRIGTKPYVIMPASAEESEAISATMNQLMDAGIRFVEVSLADATKIIAAEKAALSRKTLIFPSTSIPSGIDLLLSVERGYGSYGPIYVGRVIRSKDGQLLALQTQPDVGPMTMGALISKLVQDSLTRLSQK